VDGGPRATTVGPLYLDGDTTDERGGSATGGTSPAHVCDGLAGCRGDGDTRRRIGNGRCDRERDGCDVGRELPVQVGGDRRRDLPVRGVRGGVGEGANTARRGWGARARRGPLRGSGERCETGSAALGGGV